MAIGFGPPDQTSVETGALRAIDSGKQQFVNQDFVKNIAWLNQSVDTLSAYTQKLQSGVDSANSNFIGQIQGVIADIFVLIAGGEPTGIDLGDLKYILQALGSLFGINPDTPFPLNLVEAVAHMFTNFLAPLPQFTDLIFDAMAAWAEDLGFSDAAVDSIQEFNDAVVRWFNDFDDALGIVGDLLSSLLKMIGFGSGGCGTGILGDLWNEVAGFISGIIEGPRQLLLSILSQIVVLIFKTLTFIVNATNPMGLMSMFGMTAIGPQLAPEITNKTTEWTIGSNPNTSWVYDSTLSHGGSDGSLMTNGNGTNKRVLSQKVIECNPGADLNISAWVYWSGIPTDRNTYGPCIVFYSGSNELSQTNVNATSGHGASGGWAQVAQTVVVPQNANGFRIGARISNEINTGVVRVDQISCTETSIEFCQGGLIGGIGTFVGNLVKTAFISVEQLVGWIPEMLFGWIPIGHLSDTQPNLWPAGMFPADSFAGNAEWSWDSTKTKSTDGTGSAKVTANSKMKAARGIATPVASGQKLSLSIFCSWSGYSGSNSPVQLQVVTYSKNSDNTYTQKGIETVATIDPAGPSNNWTELAATYTVPAGVDQIRPRLVVTEDAHSGTFYFDDASCKQAGKIQQSWVDGLGDAFQEVIGRWQLLINTIFKAFTGQVSLTTTIEDLFLALLNIPFGNVLGVNGPTNIGQTIIDFLDNLIGGFVGKHGSNGGFSDLFNVANIISGWANLGSLAWEILGLRNNTPVYTGLLPNGKSNYPITGINTTLNCTQAASLIATFRIGESSPWGVVSWLGYGTTNITNFYVNIWKIDASSGDWTLAHHSPDLKTELSPSSTPQWHFYEIAEPLPAVAGEEYAVELYPVGSGTHHVRGMSTTDQIPDHPYAKVVRLAAKRDNTTDPDDPPESIDSSVVTSSDMRSGDIPWIELAIDTGNAPGYHDPVTIYMTENGSVPIPNWCGYIEAIGLGGGGGGKEGATLGFYGEGGKAGKWNAVMWERGVHFDHNTTLVEFTRGAGGTAGTGIPIIGGALGGNGGNGGATVIAIAGHSLSAAGGAGGTTLRWGGHTLGEAVPEFEFNGQKYTGGVSQNVYGSGGCPPGGGAAGGAWLLGSPGGAGAVGAGWIRFKYGAMPSDIELADVTPPTAPELALNTSGYSKLTVTASGSTDE